MENRRKLNGAVGEKGTTIVKEKVVIDKSDYVINEYNMDDYFWHV